MCVKEWKRIAEWEAMHYRDRKAFLKGVADAGGVKTSHAVQYERWVRAVEDVQRYLKRHDPEKERFFRLCFGLDDGKVLRGAKGMVSLSFQFHAGQSTLYDWKKEVLTLLLLAAAQNGALIPFEKEAQ